MATAIPPEAIERFRRLETRAAAAHALSESLRERLDRYRDEERDLRVGLSGFYNTAAVKGRIEITDDGTVEYHVVEGREPTILAERHPNAARLKRVEAAIARTIRERDEAAEASQPIRELVAACRDELKRRNWDGL